MTFMETNPPTGARRGAQVLARLADRAFQACNDGAQWPFADVADAAGLAKGTVYLYFPSKEELAFPYRERRLARFDALVQRGPCDESAYAAVSSFSLSAATLSSGYAPVIDFPSTM